MKKYKIIALFGEGGNGKDTVLKYLCQESPYKDKFNQKISCTTRPPRDYEKDGEDYYFISPADFFTEICVNDDFIEVAKFNENFYGTRKSDLDKERINIGVFSPAGIETILTDKDCEVYPLYIKAEPLVRLRRMAERASTTEDADEVVRRYEADKKDFQYLYFNYYSFDNSENQGFEKINNVIAQMLKDMGENI